MIIFRANAGSHVGLGHLVRCRVLAKALQERGQRCLIVGPPLFLKQSGDESLFDDWIERPQWHGAVEEAKFHIELAKQYNAKHIILDDYRSDFEHQLLIRNAGLRMLQQYDASRPQKFAAQLVINSSPYEKRDHYKTVLYSEDIQMLHGPRYAVLRDEFTRLPKQNQKLNRHRILVTFGGGDDRGAILTVLKALSTNLPRNSNMIVVAGKHNPCIPQISNWLAEKNHDEIELLVDPDDMPSVIASCGIAILGGGTTTFEVAYCGLPMILMPIAENQYKQGQGWENDGAAFYLGPIKNTDSKVLIGTLTKLINNPNLYDKMSKAARLSVDGHGTKHIIDCLLGERCE